MSQAVMVPSASPHSYPGSLAGVPVAVRFHSGSHDTDQAIELFEADKRRYLLEDPRYAPTLARHRGLRPEDVHLPRLRFVRSPDYPSEALAQTRRWMGRWNLLGEPGAGEGACDAGTG